MHSVLFVVVTTDLTLEQKVWWPKIVSELCRIAATTLGTLILSENVLLIPMQNGSGGISSAVETAESAGFRHMELYFQEPPQWVSSPDRS